MNERWQFTAVAVGKKVLLLALYSLDLFKCHIRQDVIHLYLHLIILDIYITSLYSLYFIHLYKTKV